jgi:hypothetical protein
LPMGRILIADIINTQIEHHYLSFLRKHLSQLSSFFSAMVHPYSMAKSHYAAMRESDDRLEVLQYLLDNHHLLNDIIYQNCGDEYYFYMYNSGIDAPLHYAAARGLLDTVELLVQRGASIEMRDPSG